MTDSFGLLRFAELLYYNYHYYHHHHHHHEALSRTVYNRLGARRKQPDLSQSESSS